MSDAPKYITGNWAHIFDGERSERMTRVVLDATTRKPGCLSPTCVRERSNLYTQSPPARSAKEPQRYEHEHTFARTEREHALQALRQPGSIVGNEYRFAW